MQTSQEFTAIYQAHAAKVFRLCMGYAGGDEDLAKEWQQQTFIKVWKHRGSFKGNASISTWIYRIAVNICLSDLRKPKRQTSLNPEMANIEETSSYENNQEENIQKMYRCIDQLTQNNKAIILLELEDIPQATIAATLGLAHGALRTRLSRIRKSLLKCITHEK